MGTESSRGARVLVPALLALVLLLTGAAWLGCSSPDQTTTTAATAAGPLGSTATTPATSPSAGQSTGDPAPGAGQAAGSQRAPVRYQQDNAYLAYTGVWTMSVTPEDAGLLSPGEHTVRIECTGKRSPGAASAFINIDGFDVVGEVLGYNGR